MVRQPLLRAHEAPGLGEAQGDPPPGMQGSVPPSPVTPGAMGLLH